MIELTPAAIAHIREFLQNRGHGEGIRVGVKTSGCSGLYYRSEERRVGKEC